MPKRQLSKKEPSEFYKFFPKQREYARLKSLMLMNCMWQYMSMWKECSKMKYVRHANIIMSALTNEILMTEL